MSADQKPERCANDLPWCGHTMERHSEDNGCCLECACNGFVWPAKPYSSPAQTTDASPEPRCSTCGAPWGDHGPLDKKRCATVPPRVVVVVEPPSSPAQTTERCASAHQYVTTPTGMKCKDCDFVPEQYRTAQTTDAPSAHGDPNVRDRCGCGNHAHMALQAGCPDDCGCDKRCFSRVRLRIWANRATALRAEVGRLQANSEDYLRDIETLRADLLAAREEIERLKKWQRDMVKITAENRLDGYRELGQKAARAEDRRDEAIAEANAAEARVAELEKIIEEAPHAGSCDLSPASHLLEGFAAPDRSMWRCDCWKAQVKNE